MVVTEDMDFSGQRGGLGSLFEDSAGSSEEDEEAGPTLMEERYLRILPEATPQALDLSLVSSRHSLWGHRLWNAAIVLAEMVDGGEIVARSKTVLELGAGAGLPGLICALRGSSRVVISDYATSADQALMVPIKVNIDRIQPAFVPHGTLHAVGHVWGHSVEELLDPLYQCAGASDWPQRHSGYPGAVTTEKEMSGSHETGKPNQEDLVGGATRPRGLGFDIVIMADLLFNRSQHEQLLASCCQCLGSWDTSEVWVSFSHHDPEKANLDMKFFDLAKDRGLQCEHMRTVQRRDIFVEDDGKDDIRGAVHVWRLTRKPGP